MGTDSRMSDQQAEIVFHGQVQGVGFRWTTARHARRVGLSGWVRNEADGSVRLVIEGPPDGMNALLEALEADFPGQIRSQERENRPASSEFSGFRILRT